MSNDLIVSKIKSVRGILANVKTLTQAKEGVAIADAVIAYGKRVNASREMMNEAEELQMRMERRLGEFLAKMPKNKGAKGSKVTGSKKEPVKDDTPTLSEIGISKKVSSRAQVFAAVPDERFEAAITHNPAKELNRNIVFKTFKQEYARKPYKRQHTIDLIPADISLVTSLGTLIEAGRKYGCIYADPPWQYGNQATRASTDNHYTTMTVEEICAEPVASLTTEEAHLYLWTTAGFLREAFTVMEAWGFTYKTNMVWVKPQMGIGNYVRLSHEHLLIGIKGSKRTRGANQMSWLQVDRTKHSRKPRVFREVVEKMSDGPYLEMYGRENIEGWTVYGNQIEKDMFA